MAIYVFNPLTAGDGNYHLGSTGSSWDAARNGTGTVIADDNVKAGYERAGSTWTVWQSFVAFDTSALGAEEIFRSAHYRHAFQSVTNDPGINPNLRLYFDNSWSFNIGSGDWFDGDDLSGLNSATLTVANFIGQGAFDVLADGNFDNHINRSGTTRFVVASSEQTSGSAPIGSDGENSVSGAQLPYLTVQTIERSHLVGLEAAQVRLSDGRTVYLESDGAFPAGTVSLKIVDLEENVDTIDTLPLGTGSSQFSSAFLARESISILRDTNDHIYVIGLNQSRNVIALGYTYDSGEDTWTAGSVKSVSLGVAVSTFTTTWRRTGSFAPFGALIWIAGLPDFVSDVGYWATIDGAAVRTSGTVTVASGSSSSFGAGIAVGLGVDASIFGARADTHDAPHLFQAWTIEPVGNEFIARQFRQYFRLSEAGEPTSLEGGGSGSGIAELEPNHRHRVIGLEHIGSNDWRFLRIRADESGELHAVQERKSGGSISQVGSFSFDCGGFFDVVLDQAEERLLVYYWDPSDNTKLLRRPYFYKTNSLGSAVEIHTNTDAGTRTVIRCSQDNADQLVNEIHYSRQSSASFFFHRVLDQANLPPTAPLLTPRTTFDADDAATFSWEFQDPNPGDTQGAYQLEIERTSDDVQVFDSTKTTSSNEFHELAAETLDNGEEYRWRVRTWDASDEEGPWSSWSTFTTTAGAIVTITSPANDALLETANFDVVWDYTQPDSEPQTSYRVVVRPQGGGSAIIDTDWVTSDSGSHALSDVPIGLWTIEVTARTDTIESNTDSVNVEVDYEFPDEPTISIEARPDYIRVQVTNPGPTGSRPFVNENRIFRRALGQAEFSWIGTVGNNEAYRDYTAASGVTYEYFVRAVG